ncbi:hypothetical protein [Myroides indicus]|uniref:Uncharacterized protein n=1 Tax=Myroides indicus TaxID=1323422 RepID=A0A4R7ESU0_9FLAO|nr:hypothetical protein [Myroides indicus]TDS56860.1 hypothetical protein C8P70_1188 [Myroides indicus]
MKKIIFIAALLGTVYFAQAQIAVGTPQPKTSAYLDVEATDKGILIPRVALRSTDAFAPITGDQEQSLLVFNTEKSAAGATAVTPGFYYWRTPDMGAAYWERVASATDLKELIGTVDTDIVSVLELLKTAYPSNNLDGTSTGGDALGGGMVYEPGDATTPAKITYVYYDSTTNKYVKKDITSDFEQIIADAESKTLLVKNAKYQYYVSETYLVADNGMVPDQTVVDTWTDTTFPAGVYYIDVIGGVVNNFSELVTNNQVTVGGNTYNSIQEYIENISQDAMQDGVTRIIIDQTTGEATFQTWDSTSNQWINVNNSSFSEIVRDNETVTTLTKEGTTGAVGNEIKYTYVSEDNTTTVITLTADVLSSITNNENIKNEISKIINTGGNVYFGDHDSDVNTPDVFYTIDASGNKVAINISSTVVNTIINASQEQINQIKNVLGDVITNTSNTSVFTGDTYVDNGVTYYVYKGEFETTVIANTARTTGITLDQDAHKILFINLDYGTGMVAPVNDVTVAGTSLGFNIGIGHTYHVIDITKDVDAKAIVEFASSTKPSGIQ